MDTLPNKNLEKDILAAILKHQVPIWEARRALHNISVSLGSLVIPREVTFQYEDQTESQHITYEQLVQDTSTSPDDK